MPKATRSLAAVTRFALFAGLTGAACSSSTPDDTGPRFMPLPELTSAAMTDRIRLAPKTPRVSADTNPNPADPTALASYLERGFGELAQAPGEAHTKRTIDGSKAQAPGPNRKRLLRFVHMPDLQLSDDESPNRVGNLDGASAGEGALRPQDAFICRMVNASVRTINALHREDPIAFVLLGGDNADSAQDNELSWVLKVLGGAPELECESGNDDDMTPGPNNDGKDPFKPEGLAVPWKWVTGNHDVNVQGTFRVDDAKREIALGTTAPLGTRDYARGGATYRGDFVVQDAKRALLSRTELMTKIAADGDGHGVGDAQKATGKGIYTFDVPESPVRFLVLDTAAETGGAEGVIHESDVDSTIRPALDKARADGRWVILASHHAVANLSTDGGAFGQAQPDALSSAAWTTLIGAYPNVVFSMVGHSHHHAAKAITPAGGHAWWEVMSSAIADFPHQFRVLELYDEDNGWLMLRATCTDFSTENDSVAAEGRARGVVDFTSGWQPGDGRGAVEDRNVELWIRKP
jgi:hypothetical protein